MGDVEKRPVVNAISPGMLLGMLLIGGGVLLFLDNLDILPFRAALLFWPLSLVCFGVFTLANSRCSTNTVIGIGAVVAGVLLGLGKFGLINVTARTLWPLALIAVGIMMLMSRSGWYRPMRHIAFSSSSDAGSLTDRLQEFAVFSGVKRRIESMNFEGGALSSMFGGIEIDLRRAGIANPSREVTIEANAAFGGIEIRVPETWRVSLQGTAIFGAYEDKTFPPRPEPGVDSPLLIIRGGTAFGAVVVQN